MTRPEGIIIGILGLIFGSFGSVILNRLGDNLNRGKRKGFLWGHSECPKCHHKLKRNDLIPLWSFIHHKGKCAYCHKKISLIYPLLEGVSAILFITVFYIFEYNDIFLSSIITLISRLSFIIALYDILHMELHLTATIGVFILNGILAIHQHNIMNFLIRTGIFFGVFIGIYYGSQGFCYLKYHEKKEGFGFGDVIFATSIGGLFPILIKTTNTIDIISIIVTYIIFCCLLGIFYYSISSLMGKKNKSDSTILPFIPSMVGALWIFIIVGEKILFHT